MMDKELIESLNLSERYIRTYENAVFYESALEFIKMFDKKESIKDEPEHQAASHTENQEARQIYAIRDVWYALSTATSITLQVILSWLFLAAFLKMAFSMSNFIGLLIVSVGGICGIYTGLKTWKVHHPGVVIDLSKGTLSFAAEDIENTLWEIVTFKQFFIGSA